MSLNYTSLPGDNISYHLSYKLYTGDITYQRITVHLFFAETVVIFLLNSICLFVMLKERILLKNLQNIYLTGLLISHGGNGFVFIVAYATQLISWDAKITINKIRYMFYASACSYTFLLSLDRYLAIRRPFYYQTLSKRFITATNIAAISYTLVFIVSFHLSQIYGVLVATCAKIAVGTTLSIFNATLYFELRKQFRAIQSTCVHKSADEHISSAKKGKLRQTRALKLCVFITVSYMLFWYPHMFSTVHYFTTGYQTNVTVLQCLELLALLDSIVDPLIYIYLNKTVKRKIREFGAKVCLVNSQAYTRR